MYMGNINSNGRKGDAKNQLVSFLIHKFVWVNLKIMTFETDHENPVEIESN